MPIDTLAEGTKEVAPNSSIVIDGTNTTDIAALLIDHPEYNNFATYTNGSPQSRLNINIDDPTQECIFLGFSAAHINQTGAVNFEYRIKDPNGNIVFGPILVNASNSNVLNWNQGFNGPSALVGSAGYAETVVSTADLTSQGWNAAGDYYIEFENLSNTQPFLIDFWDITVVSSCGSNPTAKKGRIWSFNWAFFAVNDFGFPNRPFNGSFHVCAPDPDDVSKAFITKIDFDGSGFRPAAFNIAFNSFGVMNTGTIEQNRRSIEDLNSTNPEYAIFLNDPVDLCETAVGGEIRLIGISRCAFDDYCIKISASKEGQIELLLDFDGGDHVYTPGTADVMVTTTVSSGQTDQPICIPWDGLDGLGQALSESMATTIPVTIAFAQGIYHFPIYDAELMTNGFTISAVRPAGLTPNLFYDDTQLSTTSGTTEPALQLNGCNLPCHRWTNYFDATITGFGNLSTINSWWFSQLIVEEDVFFLPTTYSCEIVGPDTVCLSSPITLNLALEALPLGSSFPTVVQTVWQGPSIVGSPLGDQIVVSSGGIYTATTTWINSLGDSCVTTCSKEIFELTDCCQLAFECTPIDSLLHCIDEMPLIFVNLEELLASGLIIIFDQDCGQVEMTSSVFSNLGTGCNDDPLITGYRYSVWDDSNGNGKLDDSETSIACSQTYTIENELLPTLTFSGDLVDLNSGDTVSIECLAGDTAWSIPFPTINDVTTTIACGSIVVVVQDSLIAQGDCLSHGFIRLYQCTWLAEDDCGNTAELVLYMKLVDTQAPNILSTASDVIITCTDEIPTPESSALDACDCAHLEVTLDTLTFECASHFTLLRTYTWSDHCGNKATSTQNIHIEDQIPLQLTLEEYQNGEAIEVNCEYGTLPFSIAMLNENSIDVTTSCARPDIQFSLNQLESGDCSAGYKARYRLTWNVNDDCGNQAEFNLFVQLVDHEPPMIVSFPQVLCDGTFNPDDLVVSDNCGNAYFNHNEVLLQDQCHKSAYTKHIWTVFDDCGNTITDELLIYPGDLLPPQIILLPPYEDLNNGDSLLTSCALTNELTDYSSIAALSSFCEEDSRLSFEMNEVSGRDCATNQLKLEKLTWTAVDACGNTNTFTLYLKVEYNDFPPPFSSHIGQRSCGDLDFNRIESTCDVEVELENHVEQSLCIGLSFEAYLFQNDCGEESRDTIWYEIIDETAPTFSDLPQQICTTDDLPAPLAYDDCDAEYVDVNLIEFFDQSCGVPIRTVVYFARDACGNEARHEMQILPTQLELSPRLFYEDQLIFPNSDGIEIDVDCAFAFELSQFRIEPDCPYLFLSFAEDLTNENCDNSIFYRSILHTVQLNTTCGELGSGSIKINYIDQQAPIFISPPEDITVFCEDMIPFPDLASYENCSEVINEKTQIELPSIEGINLYQQNWMTQDECRNQVFHERLVTSFNPPTCQITVPIDTILCYTTQRIHANVVSAAEPLLYEWSLLQGNCNLEKQVTRVPVNDVTLLGASTTIQLTVIDRYGCESHCEIELSCEDKPFRDDFVEEEKQIGEESPEVISIRVYPNPVTQRFYFSSDKIVKTVGIIGFDGRIMNQIPFHSMSEQIDLTSFSDGIYFVDFKFIDGTHEIKKLIKISRE